MVYLGLGSNIGDRCAWLRRGLSELERAGVEIVRVSSLYLTEPVGDSTMPWFVNCVAAATPRLTPGDLLRACLEAERACGRVRTSPDPEPRPLDVDLLLYGPRVVDEPGLRIPHPRLHERRFVLKPLAELAAGAWTDGGRPAESAVLSFDAVHPLLGADPATLLEGLLDGGEGVWLLAPGNALLSGA